MMTQWDYDGKKEISEKDIGFGQHSGKGHTNQNWDENCTVRSIKGGYV